MSFGGGCWRTDKTTGKGRRFGFHHFDKTSGRCECGRWAPGRKPKVSPQDEGRCECQVCENFQKTDRGGRLVLHGYKRPGWGYILGECYGVNALPFPETDRLEAWLIAVDGQIERLKSELAKLPTREDVMVSIRVWVGYSHQKREGTKDGYKAKLLTVRKAANWPDYTSATIAKNVHVEGSGWEKDYDDKSPEAEAVRHSFASFEAAVESVMRTLSSHLTEAKAERKRVHARIAKGTALRAAAKPAVGAQAEVSAQAVAS